MAARSAAISALARAAAARSAWSWVEAWADWMAVAALRWASPAEVCALCAMAAVWLWASVAASCESEVAVVLLLLMTMKAMAMMATTATEPATHQAVLLGRTWVRRTWLAV